jgi:collagen type VII alpha
MIAATGPQINSVNITWTGSTGSTGITGIQSQIINNVSAAATESNLALLVTSLSSLVTSDLTFIDAVLTSNTEVYEDVAAELAAGASPLLNPTAPTGPQQVDIAGETGVTGASSVTGETGDIGTSGVTGETGNSPQ